MLDRHIRMRAKTDEELVTMLNDNLQIVAVVAPTIANYEATYDQQMARRALLFAALDTVREVTLEQYIRNNKATDLSK